MLNLLYCVYLLTCFGLFHLLDKLDHLAKQQDVILKRQSRILKALFENQAQIKEMKGVAEQENNSPELKCIDSIDEMVEFEHSLDDEEVFKNLVRSLMNLFKWIFDWLSPVYFVSNYVQYLILFLKSFYRFIV